MNATPGRPASPGAARSSAQIRADIDVQRQQLETSVEELRFKVAELTDWRRQVREHKQELIYAAAAVGFVVGGLAMLRRRRR